MLFFKGNGKYPYPPSSKPTCNPPPVLPFSAYEIPQFILRVDFKRPGARMPREEANIMGKIKYNLQLNGVRHLKCKGEKHG